MRKLILTIAFVLAGMLQGEYVWGQMFREDGYDYHYDYDHRVVVRSCVKCEEDYQGLWNGDYVRLINDRVYIYNGNNRVLYGDRVWLEHTGDYTVEIGNTQYLYDCDGDRIQGIYGKPVYMLWNSRVMLCRSGYYYLYTRSGYRLGSVYSDTEITLYWNGYYCCHIGGYYYVVDSDGDRIGDTYSDEEPELQPSGQFLVVRNGKAYLKTVD